MTLKELEIKLFQNQVSGKNAKFSDTEESCIYKKLSQNQYDFYRYMETVTINLGQYKLKAFIPNFKGIKTLQTSNIVANPQDSSKIGQWMNHIVTRNQSENQPVNQFLALENLSMGYKYPCMMDLKLGRKKLRKKSDVKFEKSTTNSHHFRINGMSSLYVQQNQPHFISKYYFQKISEEEIQAHLSFFFFDGQNIDINLIKNCINEIKDMILALQCFKAGCFNSSSLLICYDGYDHKKYSVKLIDFDKYLADDGNKQQSDQNIIKGLKYIVWYFNSIVQKYQLHELNIRNKKLKLLQQFQLIPPQKIKQFLDKINSCHKQSISDISSCNSFGQADLEIFQLRI